MAEVSLADRLDGYQQRHPRLGFPLAVILKYNDDQGGNLAALIAYYGFVSLFPLLLLMSTVLGLVLAHDAHAQQQVLHSALSQFPVIGQQLQTPQRIGGGALGVVVGSLGALYGGLGVAQAVQNAMNTAWSVPRRSRPGFVQARGRSLLLLLTVGGALLGSSVLTAVGTGAGSQAVAARVGTLLTSVVLNAWVFILAFRITAGRDLTVRQVAPGALVAAVLWQLLQTFGATYVGHVVKNAGATNGVFALVLGLIAFLYLAAVMLIICAEINVVRVDHLWPRGLMAPFSDDAPLTSADRRTYAEQARAQRATSGEQIDVTFTEAAESPLPPH